MKAFIFGTLTILVLAALISVRGAGAHTEHDKTLNAECSINESGQDCAEGLICVPFNQHSGNGKCEAVPTPTPKVSCTPTPSVEVTPSPTPEATVTPTEEPVYPNLGSDHGDGKSDGRSDGQHTAPDGLGCAAHECDNGNPNWAKLPLK